MTDRPSNTGREDTVALPRQGSPRSNGSSNGSGGSTGSNGRVLPPMPSGQDTPPAAPPAGAPAKRPAPRKAPAAKKAAPAAKKAPAPAPAKKAAARPAATAAATAAPVAQPSPATQATPAARAASTARPAAAPPPVVPATQEAPAPARTPKPAKPSRQEKRAAAAAAAPRPGRRARLRLTRIDPWSMMKTSFLLSIALGIVIVVSVLMVWTVLGAADVWTSINQTVQDVVGDDTSTFDIEDYLGTSRVVGFTMIVAAVDVVLVTAICTLGAFLYNMSASLLGGLEVTLAED